MRITLLLFSLSLPLAGCRSSPMPPEAAPAAGALPVQVVSITPSPVALGDTYVATIRSRRSATMQPQVSGNITSILVHAGQHVQAGQLLLTIDPLKQQATVEQQQGAEAQRKAALEFNKADEARQRQLFSQGLISRAAYDQATQGLHTSEAEYAAARAQTRTEQEQLAYYQIHAPFGGTLGDVPVHRGDYVTPSVVLTTLDENTGLEAYIYIPTDRASQARLGLPVELTDTAGQLIARSQINFLSPEVDNGTQTILAKAPVPEVAAGAAVRNQQLIKARVIWTSEDRPVVPVLAVTRVSGQAFVFVASRSGQGYVAHQVAVTLGDSSGNQYPVLSGLRAGDKVITSSLQMLAEGMPVQPAS